MPGMFGSAPLLTPWFGMWDIANGSSESQMLVAAGLFTIVLAGVVLSLYGSHVRVFTPEQKPVAAPVSRPRQRRRLR